MIGMKDFECFRHCWIFSSRYIRIREHRYRYVRRDSRSVESSPVGRSIYLIRQSEDPSVRHVTDQNIRKDALGVLSDPRNVRNATHQRLRKGLACADRERPRQLHYRASKPGP